MTSKPAIKAFPDVGFSKVVKIIIVVLFPAPLGPKNPKISPFSTEKETSFTAVRSPNDLVRDFVSIEYNNSIYLGNYKLLSIRSEINHKKFKKSILRTKYMKGLCQKCHSSNIEITLEDGMPVCVKCAKK
tara:strand:+ start:304 stop:693 length:390 start_codon:yes stop_codon:yes gene_type:complete